ncbi:MAG: hypothetical protein QXZ47_05645 [Candidatus Bathyarchaeia archaeon]
MTHEFTIEEVNRIIEVKRVPYGKDIILPLKINTAPCEEFFGKRCPYNIHVTGERTAHKDRFDPRYYWKEHLDHDVMVPHEILTIGIPTIAGVTVGALLDNKNRTRGALIGGFFGFISGILCEILL